MGAVRKPRPGRRGDDHRILFPIVGRFGISPLHFRA